jgi:MFS family permease
MLVLPLYYQVGRGQTALTAGLLMAPQGIGAALAIPFAGRLTDRIGGGPVVLVGSAVATLGTLPFVWVGSGTSYALLAVVLVVRGVGIGSSMMPAMAAAFAVLRPDEVPRATSALNALQRIGGSIGTALLAVVLQHETRALSTSGAPLATAFGPTFTWAAALTLLALAPAAVLAISERSARSSRQRLQLAAMR